MRLQNKKNLRQRMNRLHLSVNGIVEYGILLIHQGSLRKGAGPIKLNEKSYDLDVDFCIKTNDSAKEVRTTIYKAISKNLRIHEVVEDKTRVIRVVVSASGYNYNFDIAIKKLDTDEVAIYKNGQYQWMS